MTSTLTSKGQITIPLPIREEWGLQRGDKVSFSVVLQGVLIQRMSRPVQSLRGILPKPKRRLSIEQMRKVIAKEASKEERR